MTNETATIDPIVKHIIQYPEVDPTPYVVLDKGRHDIGHVVGMTLRNISAQDLAMMSLEMSELPSAIAERISYLETLPDAWRDPFMLALRYQLLARHCLASVFYMLPCQSLDEDS